MSKKGIHGHTSFFKSWIPRFRQKRKHKSRAGLEETGDSFSDIAAPRSGSSLGLQPLPGNSMAEPMLKDEANRMNTMYTKIQEVLDVIQTRFTDMQRSLAEIVDQVKDLKQSAANSEPTSWESVESVDAYCKVYMKRLSEMMEEKSAVFANIVAPYRRNQADLERLIGMYKEAQNELAQKTRENAELESLSNKYELENENLIAGIRRLRSENWELELYLNSQAERISRSYRCKCSQDEHETPEPSNSICQEADQDQDQDSSEVESASASTSGDSFVTH